MISSDSLHDLLESRSELAPLVVVIEWKLVRLLLGINWGSGSIQACIVVDKQLEVACDASVFRKVELEMVRELGV